MCIDRRELLRAGFATLAAGSIPASSMFAMGTQAAGGGSQRVIMINIRGGWDSLSVVVPHGRSEYYNRRPTLAIPAPGAYPLGRTYVRGAPPPPPPPPAPPGAPVPTARYWCRPMRGSTC